MNDDSPAQNAAALNEWSRYVEGLLPLGDTFAAQLGDPDDALLRHEMYRMMHMYLGQGWFEIAYQDSEYPDFWPAFNQAFNYALINPDDTYHMTPLKPGGVYRISGYRGTVRQVDFQIATGEFFYTGFGALGPTLKNYDLDHDVTIGADTSFEVLLSPERPAGHTGDWWPLDPKATHLLVRQISYDWIHDVDGRFAIERLDLPAIKPRDNTAKIAAQLAKIPPFVANWTQWTHAFRKRLHDQGLVNKVSTLEMTEAGGISTQIYLNGLFELDADEALLIELTPPEKCFYWSITLYDELLIAIDWQNRQAHLNGLTATPDADGKYRFVISAQDPGVPNWLDSAGYRRGCLFGRFNQIEGKIGTEVRRVPLAELRRQLPAETPVVTPQQRDAIIRKRRTAVQLRHRW